MISFINQTASFLANPDVAEVNDAEEFEEEFSPHLLRYNECREFYVRACLEREDLTWFPINQAQCLKDSTALVKDKDAILAALGIATSCPRVHPLWAALCLFLCLSSF